MTTLQIAQRLAALCESGDFEKAQQEFYADDAVSIEPYETPDFEKVTRGLPAILEKGKKFGSMVETMHAITVSEPLVAGNAIAFILSMDIKMKDRDRVNLAEICVYEVKGGKVISEQFFL